MPTAIYLNQNQVKVSSVTQINALGPEKRALIYAANKLGLDGRNVRDAWYSEAAHAGEIGHLLVQAAIQGREPKDDEFPTASARTLGLNAYAAYCKWNQGTNIKWVDTELSLVSEKHQYGGTIDAIGIPNGSNTYVLGEWKTGALYDEQLHQIAAYWKLFEECTGHAIAGAHLCRFNKLSGDFVHAYFDDLEPEWEAFLAKRYLWDKLKALPKRLR